MNKQNVVTLRIKDESSIPVEADSICPDFFAKRTNSEIRALPIFYGRRKIAIGDLFSVEGQASDKIIIQGNLDHFKRIGQKMTRGTIEINGNAGMHLGAYMQGGEILVHGCAHDWLGAHMKGGIIRIQGDTGHFAGGGYPGEKRGANHGVILINGSAGNETGVRMRRGLIVIMGDTGEFTGANLIAGTICVFGHLGERAGAGNKRGTIVALKDAAPLLPTYRYQCRYQPVFLRLYIDYFRKLGIPDLNGRLSGYFRRFAGDINTVGKGEILIYDQH